MLGSHKINISCHGLDNLMHAFHLIESTEDVNKCQHCTSLTLHIQNYLIIYTVTSQRGGR